MNPLQWALLPLRRYADFRGRSQRAEYWWFLLATIVLFFALLAAAGTYRSLDPDTPIPPATTIVVFGYFLTMALPTLAVQVRRLHDADMSGWHICWGFIPYLGGWIVLGLMVRDGTVGDNRFGADPKSRTLPTLESLFD